MWPILLCETSANARAIVFICDSLPWVSPAVVLLAKEVQNCMEYNVCSCINSLFPIKIQTSQSQKTGATAYFFIFFIRQKISILSHRGLSFKGYSLNQFLSIISDI